MSWGPTSLHKVDLLPVIGCTSLHFISSHSICWAIIQIGFKVDSSLNIFIDQLKSTTYPNFFRAGALFLQKHKILAYFSQFVLFCHKFTRFLVFFLKALNSVVVYQKLQITGMVTPICMLYFFILRNFLGLACFQLFCCTVHKPSLHLLTLVYRNNLQNYHFTKFYFWF